MADDIIDQNFPYGESAALAGAKFREVETVDTFTGQVGVALPTSRNESSAPGTIVVPNEVECKAGFI